MKMIKRLIVSLAICMLSSFCLVTYAEEIDAKQDKAFKEYVQIMNSLKKSKTDYEEYFAGAYLNNDKELVILLTDEGLNKQITFSDDVIIQKATYSIKELNSTYEAIKNRLENNQNKDWFSNFTGVGISQKDNAVVVYLVDLDDGMIKEFEKSILKSDLIIFEQKDRFALDEPIITEDEPLNIATDSTAAFSSKKLDLGSEIRRYTSNSNYLQYSVGFRAKCKIGSVNYLGFVTAGHNMTNDVDIYDGSRNLIGQTKVVKFNSKVDAAFVHTSKIAVSSQGFEGTVINGDRYYTDTTFPGVDSLDGFSICKIGSAGDWNAGVVLNSSFTANYNMGNNTNHILYDTILANFESKEGDSGGIIYMPFNENGKSVKMVVGIANGVDKQKKQTIICKAKTIMDNLNVTPY